MGTGAWQLNRADFRAAGLAFLIVCVPPAIYFSLNSPGVGSYWGAPLIIIALWSAIFFLYALGISGLFAFPLFLVLNRLRLLSATTAVVSGIVAGIGSGIVIKPSSAYEAGPYLAVAGGLLGAIFWMLFNLLRRRNEL